MGKGMPKANQLRLVLTVMRCQAGDERAFRELYDRFAEGTHRYLCGMLDTDVAEDVHQESWLSVYRRVSELAEPARFRTWLFQIIHRRALDQIRRGNRRIALSTRLQIHAWPNVAGPLDDEIIGRLAPSRLSEAMLHLPQIQREVVALRYWEDMSYAEIAVVLGCAIGTVRSRLHSAKLRLRDILSEGPDP